MVYSPNQWQDDTLSAPYGPLSASRLNNIESGIVTADAHATTALNTFGSYLPLAGGTMSGTVHLKGPLYSVRAYGAVGDGTTDDTTAITNAIAAAQSAGGGIIWFGAGKFLTSPISIPQPGRVWLLGSGRGSTVLMLKANSNANFITNHVSSNGTSDPNASFIKISDLLLDGNKANQSGGGPYYGVYFNTNPSLGNMATADVYPDLAATRIDTPQHIIDNVGILNVKGSGFGCSGLSETRITKSFTYKCDGNGFEVGFDTSLEHCTAAWSGIDGFVINGPSAILTSCKAYYSGQSSSGNGFYVHSVYGASLTGCIAQDNSHIGFSLDNASACTLTGCIADSNSTGSNGTYPGFDLWQSSNNVITGSAFDRGAQSNHQKSALQLRTSSINNNIRLSWSAQGTGVITTALLAGGTQAGNNIVINGQLGLQAPVFASSFTPDPYSGSTIQLGALTANLTVNAPTNLHVGCPLTMMLLQDGTGGRTVTWNAAFKTSYSDTGNTANKRAIISFVYDGTNWIETSIRTWA